MKSDLVLRPRWSSSPTCVMKEITDENKNGICECSRTSIFHPLNVTRFGDVEENDNRTMSWGKGYEATQKTSVSTLCDTDGEKRRDFKWYAESLTVKRAVERELSIIGEAVYA